MSVLSAPHFHNEKAAYAYVEARVWPQGPVCPHCGCVGRIYELKGKSTRIGVRKCGDCRKPFTVKVGTIFEASHVPLRYWLQAMFLMASSKKGISANQLHRTLGVTLKTAWFMAHRIREAMIDGSIEPFGGQGGIVEADETFIGFDPESAAAKAGKTRHAYHHKLKVMSLIDRDTGRALSVTIPDLRQPTLEAVIDANVAPQARMVTDDAPHYRGLAWGYADHRAVQHGKGQYVVKGEDWVHTNTVEGHFSIFKRGMRGVYQHCSGKHLQRYLAEFDFRYSNRVALGVDDQARTGQLVKGIAGKRLTYRTARERAPGYEARIVW